jgi:hypothetical protein
MAVMCACLLFISGGCTPHQETTAFSSLPATSSVIKEIPNTMALTNRFSLLGIGRIEGYPIGKTRTVIATGGDIFPPENLEQDVSVFYAGENIIIYGRTIMGTSIRAVCYDVATGHYTKIDYWGPSSFGGTTLTAPPGEIVLGQRPAEFILPTYLELEPGQYEMKIYTEGILVAVFPFGFVE